jgi:hypothetical protein
VATGVHLNAPAQACEPRRPSHFLPANHPNRTNKKRRNHPQPRLSETAPGRRWVAQIKKHFHRLVRLPLRSPTSSLPVGRQHEWLGLTSRFPLTPCLPRFCLDSFNSCYS